MARRAVAGREALAGDDEGGGVGPPVEEEVGDDVEREQRRLAQAVVREP